MSDVGRPTVMTPEAVGKLEDAFSKGCTITEACLLADISRDSYYDYIKLNPDFSNKVEMLREKPAMHARMNIAASILGGDLTDSKWYLERKKKSEFSSSTNVNLGGQEDGVPISQSLVIEFVGTDDNKTS